MTDLAKGTFTDYSVEVEVIEGDLSGEVDILRGGTTHGWETRRGGLEGVIWLIEKWRGIRRIKRERQVRGALFSTRKPGKRRGAAKATWLGSDNNKIYRRQVDSRETNRDNKTSPGPDRNEREHQMTIGDKLA
jgi:hypothetical protein